jgi:hypothetical protein
VICIDADRQAVKKLQAVAPENLDSAVLAVCDKQFFEVGRVEDTLRHALSADALDSFARFEVDHLYGVLIVTEYGSEQTPAFNVYAKVIHSARDVGHGNGLDALQGELTLGVGVVRSHGRQYEANDHEHCLSAFHW